MNGFGGAAGLWLLPSFGIAITFPRQRSRGFSEELRASGLRRRRLKRTRRLSGPRLNRARPGVGSIGSHLVRHYAPPSNTMTKGVRKSNASIALMAQVKKSSFAAREREFCS